MTARRGAPLHGGEVMAAQWKRWFLSAAGAAALCTGCNLGAMSYFLFSPEPQEPPGLQGLATKDNEREVRVVVLTYSQPDVRPEVSNADRELSRALVQHLREAHKFYKEKVVEISPTKVDNYKANHPSWSSQDLREIGQHFQADYIIYLEINRLQLFEEGSGNTLLRGKAEITTSLIDVAKEDSDVKRKEEVIRYPGESRYAFDANEKTPAQFRQEFLDYVAKKISWCFVPRPTGDAYSCE